MGDFIADGVQASHAGHWRGDRLDRVDGMLRAEAEAQVAATAELQAGEVLTEGELAHFRRLNDGPAAGGIGGGVLTGEGADQLHGAVRRFFPGYQLGHHSQAVLVHQPPPQLAVSRDINGVFHFDWSLVADMAKGGDVQACMLLQVREMGRALGVEDTGRMGAAPPVGRRPSD